MTHKPQVIKQDGSIQRSDVELTKEVAVTLVQNILLGAKLLTKANEKRGYIEILNNEGNVVKIQYNTLRMWVVRNNVIPETGSALRDLLDGAREEYRNAQNREMDKKREAVIDKELNKVMAIKTKEPVIGMFGVIKDRETGKVVMKHNVKLLSEKMKNVRFLAERLFPHRYGKVERSENKHVHFSLSDLRKFEEDKIRQQQ